MTPLASARAGDLAFLLHRVRDLVTRPPVMCAPETSAVEVARTMLREGVGSVLVTGIDGAACGIVTDRDLRRRIVAERRDALVTRAVDIMSAPLVTIRPGAFAFEAVLEMTRRAIHHLVVTEEGRAVGVVSSRDLLAAQTTNPVLLAREISRAESFAVLAALGIRITSLTRRLIEEGAGAYDVGQIISELNDRVVIRVLGLAAAALEEAGDEPPPVAYCWLSFGSEARREQTLRTDQDNGLVFADPPEHLQERAATYYARLAEEVVRGLVQVGVPPCPGGIMASNPRWCQPLSVWRESFRYWITRGAPAQVLAASIHFDLRSLAGASELAESLRALIRQEAPGHRGFLRLLALDVVERPLPLTIFGGIRTVRTGFRRGAVDLKGGGTMQLVGAARVHALEHGLSETNTLDRFRAEGHPAFPPRETREITEAMQHLMRLRLMHQLEQQARGEPTDNFVVPARLARGERLLLREALRTVRRVQTTLRQRFATDVVPR